MLTIVWGCRRKTSLFSGQYSHTQELGIGKLRKDPSIELTTVGVEKPDDINFVLGQSHFIKTVEDIHETLVQAVPGIKFGLAFASPR